jgi:DNA-binding CsgD family transcriptional regulator
MHPERVRWRAVELYESGLSSRAAARQLKRELGARVTPQTVAAWARELGISRPVGDRRRAELPREAVCLYESGLTLAEIGCRLHVGPTTVAKRLREMGVQIRHRGLQYTRLCDKTWLEDQYVKKGTSAKEIARALGCVVLTVHYHLRKHGIPRKRKR